MEIYGQGLEPLEELGYGFICDGIWVILRLWNDIWLFRET